MGKLRVRSFSVSLDGFAAGPNQGIEHPMGIGGKELHEWVFPTATLQKTLFGNQTGASGIDNDFAARGFENIGAWIMGRNMFGPIRGPWPDEAWKGWWGDRPPVSAGGIDRRAPPGVRVHPARVGGKPAFRHRHAVARL